MKLIVLTVKITYFKVCSRSQVVSQTSLTDQGLSLFLQMFSLNFLFPFKILAIGLQKVFCSQLDCFRMLISPSKREMQTRNSGRRNFINESSSQAIRMGPPGKWCTEGLNRAPQSNVESTGPGRPSAYLSSLPDFKNHLSFWRDASSNIKYHRL